MVRAPDCGSGCRGFESHLPPHKSRGSGLFPGPRTYFPVWGRSQAVRQGTLTPSCAGSSPAVPASSEIPLTAPFPPGGENCAGREISSLLQGGAGSPLRIPHPCGGRWTGDEGSRAKVSAAKPCAVFTPAKMGAPAKSIDFVGREGRNGAGAVLAPQGGDGAERNFFRRRPGSSVGRATAF